MLLISTIILGMVLAIIAAFCFNFAVILQKLGLNDIPEVNFEKGIGGILNSFKLFFLNKFWLAGFLLGIAGWFPYIIAIGLVSVLVVSPIINIGLIIFVIAANRILKEKIGKLEYFSILLLLVATILLTLARISQVNIDINSIWVSFLIYFSCLILLSGGFFILSKMTKKSQKQGILLVFTGAILYSVGIIFTNLFTQSLLDANVNPLFFWEILFGFFWYKTHLWVSLSFYSMVFFNIVSIIFYQSGLQKNKAIIIFPIFNAITLIIPVLTGFFIFHQRFDNNLLFLLSLVLILVSTLILSRYQGNIENIQKSTPMLSRNQ